MIKFPITENWKQDNKTDRMRFQSDASLYSTRNINLDEQGYLKLSPRAITVADQASDGTIGVPVGIGKVDTGQFLVGTTSDANINLTVTGSTVSATENTDGAGDGDPTMTTDSHAVYFNGLWLASTDTAVKSRAVSTSATAQWTNRITGLTSGKKHYIAVFESKNSLCVTNGASVKQYNASYNDAALTDLTIPSDYEATGLAYNNNLMAVITRPTANSVNANAYFFIWSGVSAEADQGYDTGATAILAVSAFQSSFMLLTNKGELLYFNGGGFDRVAQFPFFNTERIWGTPVTDIGYGQIMRQIGDNLLINVGFSFNGYGQKDERYHQQSLSGVWCFNFENGLYHKYSYSQSGVTVFAVTDANINTSTDIFTVTSGTLPATGNPAIYTVNDSTPATGIKLGGLYYIIKLSATTFKLATTRQNAIDGVAIDITAKGTGGTNRFHIYNIVDYSASYITDAGAVASLDDSSRFYQDIIFGADIYNTALSDDDSVNVTVPLLENRGYAVLPKIYSNDITDLAKTLHVRFKPLNTEDKIIVKAKFKDVIGLPVSNATTASGTQATWSSPSALYTTQDLSEAKTYLDNGGELEIEIIAGAGAGSMVQVASIGEDDGTYSIELEEDVLGASATLKCFFVLDNWKKLKEIDNTNTDGYENVEISEASKFVQFKIELRGYNTTIEDLIFNNAPQENIM